MISIIVLMVWLSGALLITANREYEQGNLQKSKRRLLNNAKKWQEEQLKHEMNEVMNNAGMPINLLHYQIFRWGLLGSGIIYILYQSLKGGEIPVLLCGFVTLIYFITKPVEKTLGIKSFFQRMIDSWMKSRREKYNDELYLAIAQLKNLFLIKKDDPPTGEDVLENINKYSKHLKPIISKMLTFWMMGEREKGVKYFERSIGTNEASKLGQVLLKIDDLHPHELTEQLNAFQNLYRTQKETRKKKSNKVKSNIFFTFVTISVIMVFVNFLVVVFLIDFLKSINSFL